MKRIGAVLLCCFSFAFSQEAFRPPAVPLITMDPYFSIWSFHDRLTDDWAKHWTGTTQGLCGLIRIDGQTRRLMGRAPKEVEPLPQTGLLVMPTQTHYTFAGQGVAVKMTFTSPLLPHELNTLARPAGYLTWQVWSTDGKEHDISLYFDATMEPAVNTAGQKVTWGRLRSEQTVVLSAGSQEQAVLEKAGDNLRIDWGYFYLAADVGQNPVSVIQSHTRSRDSFVRTGHLPHLDDLRMPRPANDDYPVMAFQFDLGKVGKVMRQRYIILAYDDQYAIEYFQRKLRPYWRRGGAEAVDLLDSASREYAGVMNRCAAFDEALYADLVAVGGKPYARIASLAYRQALAAQKLAVDIDGRALLFPKENFSNGCIATVDVIYPAAPQLLLFNLELMKATLRPVLEYAMLSRWKFAFAPHDLGTYPKANGQVYGGGERTEENQMPVEESGNMLLLLAAVARADGHVHFAAPYWSAIRKWAGYLKDKGLDPENQLCTDDFAGHLAHNVNLSAKAILALGAYAQLAELHGDQEEAAEYRQTAEAFVQKWLTMADDGDHYRLAFDKAGTWSQKYNLVWDRILDLKLFPAEVAQKEVRYYLHKQNTYGLPLDNRKDYTKLDWILWTATLADRAEDFAALVTPVQRFAHESPSRVPLTDWYDTVTGEKTGFQARSVVGGVFIKMLADPTMRKKWSSNTGKER